VSLGGNPPAAEARYHLEKSLTVEVGESSRPAGVVHAQSALAASAITPIARMPGLAMSHIRASAASVRWSGELGSMGRDSSMGVTVRAGVLPALGLTSQMPRMSLRHAGRTITGGSSMRPDAPVHRRAVPRTVRCNRFSGVDVASPGKSSCHPEKRAHPGGQRHRQGAPEGDARGGDDHWGAACFGGQ